MNPSASNEPRRRPLSADDFDSPAVEHRFSDSYQQRRAALIAEFGIAASSKSARFKWRVAALAAAALIVVPVTAWAVADNAGFFAGAFGNSGRASVESHDEVQGYKDGKPFMATYPSREYVDVDLDAAERLLGAYTANQETPVSVGDHTLTILSAVRDKDAMVVHYTLERPGGVTALKWDETSNQAKGAYQPFDQPYSWRFFRGKDAVRQNEEQARWENEPMPEGAEERAAYERGKAAAYDDANFYNYGGDFTYVDPERSTADMLYCYAYVGFGGQAEDGTPVSLLVCNEDVADQVVDVPVKDVVPARTLCAEGVGELAVSPLSLRFDHSGDGDIVDEAIARAKYDRYFAGRIGSFEEYLEGCYAEIAIDACSKIVVTYENGEPYTVFDGIADLDNTTYACGLGDDRQALWLFNRLVDPDAIESITINDVVFS